MKRIETELPGVLVIEPVVFGDPRGFFLEFYHAEKFREIGITAPFVQDNQSRSQKGVVRGLHFQLGKPQAKLIRALRGEIYDVAVDVRRGSPTYGTWTGHTLSEGNHRMMFVPEGFAHGFCVVSESADILYKCTDFYAPEEERGILWNDPDLAIPWPLGGAPAILSRKDAVYKPLKETDPSDLPAA